MNSREELRNKLRNKTRQMQIDRRSLHGKSYSDLKKEKWEKEEGEKEEDKKEEGEKEEDFSPSWGAGRKI